MQQHQAATYDHDIGHDFGDAHDEPQRKYQIPWRPIYFMASICFGIASFVLPDSVNNVVQWPLYALMGASFYAGMRMRRKKKAEKKAAKAAAKAEKANAGA